MVEDVFVNDYVNRPDDFAKILEDVEKPIYPRSKFSKPSTLVKLYNLTARHWWNDVGFSNLLAFCKEFMPSENEILIPCMRQSKRCLH